MAEQAEAGGKRLVAAGLSRGVSRTIVSLVPLDRLRPNPRQPRRYFDEGALRELAESIRSRGLIHPIVVTPDQDGQHYLILAGERRYRAALLVGLDAVPVLVRTDDPLEIALIENLQRENLTPLEEAEGLARLAQQFGYSHDELAGLIGKSRPYVSNTLALCRLPEDIRRQCHETPGLSREVLIGIARAGDPDRQRRLWHLARLRNPTVRAFRAQTAGKSAAAGELGQIKRWLGRGLRKLRAIDPSSLTSTERRALLALLRRTQRTVVAVMGDLAELELRQRVSGAEPRRPDAEPLSPPQSPIPTCAKPAP